MEVFRVNLVGLENLRDCYVLEIRHGVHFESGLHVGKCGVEATSKVDSTKSIIAPGGVMESTLKVAPPWAQV